jgi:four helix bundle protein
MSRDPRQLKVFLLADQLVVDLYRLTRNFPVAERYALQSQLRRAAVSVPTNIVEGCARASQKDYLHFLNFALGSASEVRYLLGLASRLGFLDDAQCTPVLAKYDELVKGLQKLATALTRPESTTQPEA